MIPLRLRLRNFLSYRDTEPLSFDSFQIACLCGENGHGKSTLLDAITWALWGRSRAKTDDELIHIGETDMEVEFEFQLGESRYRVIRKRSRRRSQSVASLELQLDSGERFNTLSGNSIRETERSIVDLLHLDYDTFVNSSFLVQGKADSFTVSPPGKRKEILAEMLGLAQYDELESRARDHARERHLEIQRLNARIDEIDRELANEPIYRQTRDACQEVVKRLDSEVQDLKGQEDAQQQEKQKLGAAPVRIRELEGEIQDERSRHDRRRRRLEETRRELEQARDILDGREEILAGFAAHEVARQVVEAQAGKAAELQSLQTRRQAADQAVQRARADLDARRAKLSGQIQSITTVDRAALDTQIADLDANVTETNERTNALAKRRDAFTALVEQTAQHKAEQTQLRREMTDLKTQIEELRGAAVCPTCGQALSPPVRDRQIATLENDGKAMGDRFRTLKAAVDQFESKRASEERAIDGEARAIAKLQDEQGGQLARLRERRDAAARASADLERLQPQLADLERQIAERRYAEAEQKHLTALDAEIATLAFDADALKAARDRLSTYQPFVERHRRLIGAEESLDRLQREVAEHQQEIDEADRRIAEREKDLQELRGVAALLVVVEQKLAEIRSTLANRNIAHRRAEQELARCEQQLDTCEALRARRAEQEAERHATARDEGIFAELARAFGKAGVQALIIESALPEIENDANAILTRMTDGRMQVKLASQRETLQGKTVETLLIQISDELGLRNYELFSGGEAFRVNFALRIALAKLLARRADARLETLVIDEGFGTQDAVGRDRLVEAIQSIEDDFAKIIVVTHIDDLKDRFPARIEVTKDADGSKFSVLQR
ncbi:MAG: SMC family ATPase [Dehalococcoidia bacterium]